jgi:hypothetical protein
MIDPFEQLMHDAGLTAQGCWANLDEYAQDAIVKFGRLVMQECIEVVHRQDQIPQGFSYPKGAYTHELAIKQYFGIINE